VGGQPPAEFGEGIRTDIAHWAKIVKDADIQATLMSQPASIRNPDWWIRDAAALAITPPQIVGPVLSGSRSAPIWQPSLARPCGSTAEAQGQVIHVKGRCAHRFGSARCTQARVRTSCRANRCGEISSIRVEYQPGDGSIPISRAFARLTTMRPGTTAFVRSNRAAIPLQKATVRAAAIHLTVEGGSI